MPELPEVETVARQLLPKLKGQVLQNIEFYDPKFYQIDLQPILGLKVQDVFRVAKEVVVSFGSEQKTKFLAIHLRMSGRLICNSSSKRITVNKYIPDYVRLKLVFLKAELFFSDVRRFGTIRVVNSIHDLSTVGIEPLSDRLDIQNFDHLLGKSKQNIKSWLLRQDRLVGIGNIYASEILFDARLSPFKIVSSLDVLERRLLLQSIKKILRLAIKHCGTTFSDFQHVNGESGKFQKFLKVYGRDGLACRKCKTTIKRIIQGGRSSFYCPICQNPD